MMAVIKRQAAPIHEISGPTGELVGIKDVTSMTFLETLSTYQTSNYSADSVSKNHRLLRKHSYRISPVTLPSNLGVCHPKPF